MEEIRNPFDAEKEPMNHRAFLSAISNVNFGRIEREITLNIITKVNEHLKNQNPDLLLNFNEMYKELTLMMKEFKNQISVTDKKLKKVFESSSLTEDVYKIRDEMKVIKKKLDRLNAGFRGFNKLSKALDDSEESK